MPTITVETTVHAPLAQVWQCWNNPADICRWNAATPDWHTPSASVDLREGGRFTARMEAVDGSAGFDFGGIYTRVDPQRRIDYVMDDTRKVRVEFIDDGSTVTIREILDAEATHSVEQQRQGWQAILDSFRRYVEARCQP